MHSRGCSFLFGPLFSVNCSIIFGFEPCVHCGCVFGAFYPSPPPGIITKMLNSPSPHKRRNFDQSLHLYLNTGGVCVKSCFFVSRLLRFHVAPPTWNLKKNATQGKQDKHKQTKKTAKMQIGIKPFRSSRMKIFCWRKHEKPQKKMQKTPQILSKLKKASKHKNHVCVPSPLKRPLKNFIISPGRP